MNQPINWNDLEWEVVRPGVKRKVYHSQVCTVCLNHLDPGHEPKPHAHGNEQVAYIIEGETEFTVGTEVHRLHPGSMLTIPPNVEHFASVIGDDTLVNMDFFVPKREDFIASPAKSKG